MSDFQLNRIGEIAEDLKEIMINRGNNPELPILSLPTLNSKIWGLHKKKLTVIAARTSHGKSAFALQLAVDIAKQGKEVLFLSLEMNRQDMVERIFCNQKQIDNYHLLTGHFKDNAQYEKQYYDFLKEVDDMPLVFSDCIGRSWKEIDALVSGLKQKPQVIILDYIQAIKLKSDQKEGLDDYIINFRKMAIDHNFAGILCSQINRDNQNEQDKRPQLHQLKGTGVLEEHSDVVIMLYWEYKTTSNESRINYFQANVAKNRNGRTGFVVMKYQPEYYLFTEETNEIKKPGTHQADSRTSNGKNEKEITESQVDWNE